MVGHISFEPLWITSQPSEHNGAVSPSEDWTSRTIWRAPIMIIVKCLVGGNHVYTDPEVSNMRRYTIPAYADSHASLKLWS